MLALTVVALSAVLAVRGQDDDRPFAAPGDLYDYPFQQDDLAHYGEI
ncbi:hypothetical protein ABFT23_03045 [Nocardioides sp. C4-1]